MCLAVVCYIMLANSVAAPVPSHMEIAEAVIANREKIRSLHVRTYCRRMLTHREMRTELFLDDEARRWRVDTTGMGGPGKSASVGDQVRYSRSVSANGDIAYMYNPGRPEMFATSDWLTRGLEKQYMQPFLDPRNAGLVPVDYGHTGTPFEVSGGRVCLYTYYIDFCLDAVQATVKPVVWNDRRCWKVESSSNPNNRQRSVCTYIVAPEMDHSVVSMEFKAYYNKETAPGDMSSVESDVALHEKSGVWFPSQVRYVLVSQGKKVEEEVTHVDVVSLNEPIPERVFSLAGMGVPIGHRVMDLTDESSNAKVWDGEKIVRVHGLPPLADGEVTGTSRSPRSRLWCVIIAFFCVCASIILYWRGHRHSRVEPS